MALTRKFLAAMGIESEKIDEIINAHTEVTDALKDERDKFKADAEKLPSVEKELEDAKKAIDDDSESPYKVKYDNEVAEKEKLQKDFDNYKADIEAKETHAKKEKAYKEMLKEIGVSDKRLDSVLRVSKVDDIEILEDGKIKDVDTLKENAKKEWADFIVEAGTQGANVATPPANNGGGNNGASYASAFAKQFYEGRYGKVKED